MEIFDQQFKLVIQESISISTLLRNFRGTSVRILFKVFPLLNQSEVNTFENYLMAWELLSELYCWATWWSWL